MSQPTSLPASHTHGTAIAASTASPVNGRSRHTNIHSRRAAAQPSAQVPATNGVIGPFARMPSPTHSQKSTVRPKPGTRPARWSLHSVHSTHIARVVVASSTSSARAMWQSVTITGETTSRQAASSPALPPNIRRPSHSVASAATSAATALGRRYIQIASRLGSPPVIASTVGACSQ